MKLLETKSGSNSSKLINFTSPPPPPPHPPPLPPLPPLPKFATAVSVTNQEIAMYWSQKRMVEEDHLLGAIKAAARIRACNFSKDDYQRFIESLKEDDDSFEEKDDIGKVSSRRDEKIKELRVGIKDWWTKSKYAYLNQPAIKSMDMPKRRAASSYKPELQFYCYKSATPSPATTTTTFGIF